MCLSAGLPSNVLLTSTDLHTEKEGTKIERGLKGLLQSDGGRDKKRKDGRIKRGRTDGDHMMERENGAV